MRVAHRHPGGPEDVAAGPLRLVVADVAAPIATVARCVRGASLSPELDRAEAGVGGDRDDGQRRRARRGPPPGPGSRSPLPDISARPPSALSSTIVTSAPSRPGPRWRSPSAPIPRWRSHTATARAALGGSVPDGSASTRKSLPRPWCLVSRTDVSLAVRRRCRSNGSRTRRRVLVGGQPPDPRVAPEPHPLAAGEPAGPADGEVDGLVEAELAVEVGEQLAVAERLAGRPRQAGRAVAARPRTSSRNPASSCSA